VHLQKIRQIEGEFRFPSSFTRLQYLKDDCPAFDIGGYVVGESQETAVLLAKTKTVLVGLPFFDAVFEELGCTVEWLRAEGEVLEPPARIAYVRGKCRNILLGERTALNILSRASGIGALARQFSDAAKTAGWHGEIAGTRKVTPGFRLVEKYALLAGGVSTHRMDLSQMVMLKVRCTRLPCVVFLVCMYALRCRERKP